MALNRSVGHVRRLCAQRWSKQGLARQREGKWEIHLAADPRLNGGTTHRRDLGQIVELRQSGIHHRYIELAELRRSIVERFERFESEKDIRRTFSQFVASLLAEGLIPQHGIRRVTLRTLYRWRRAYHDIGIRGLVPQFDRRGRSAHNIGSKAWAVFKALVLGGNGFSVAQAYVATLGEIERNHKNEPGWEWPSQAVIEREAREKIGIELRTMANKGPRAFDARHIPKATRDVEAIASCEEWDGDQRKLDVMIRMWTSRGWQPRRDLILTAWRDMRSRAIVGHVLAPYANSVTILGSLKKGIQRFGKPQRLRVDWGRDYQKATGHIHTQRFKVDEFNGPRIGHVLDELEIEVRPVTPYHPQSKPIESFFRTLKDHCDRTFASFWGGSPDERHEDRHRWVREHLDELPTLADVQAVVDQFIDDYNNRPQSAPDLFGYTPLYAMEKFSDGPARMESDAVLDFLFGEFVGPRLVRRDGIRYLNQLYGFGDSRVIALQGRKVYLCVQPDDARTVLLCDEQKRPLFHVTCGNHVIRSQRDLERHVKMRTRLRRSARRQAREARDFFLEISPQEHLANHVAGLEALHGKPPAPDEPTRLAVVRPEIEEALKQTGSAPFEAESKAVRGDDESSLELLDLIDCEPPEPRTHAVSDDEEYEIRFEDLIGMGGEEILDGDI